ncbi:MAG: hypothetical protein ACJ72M_16255 [Propionibacteriaceae bacterium]|jgi:hypothetical protein
MCQFAEVVPGMVDGCAALGVPVTRLDELRAVDQATFPVAFER